MEGSDSSSLPWPPPGRDPHDFEGTPEFPSLEQSVFAYKSFKVIEKDKVKKRRPRKYYSSGGIDRGGRQYYVN